MCIKRPCDLESWNSFLFVKAYYKSKTECVDTTENQCIVSGLVSVSRTMALFYYPIHEEVN